MQHLNKKTIFALAFLALLGIFGCAVLANAVPCNEDTDPMHAKGTTCHFICHSSHHHWIAPSNSVSISSNAPSESFPHLSPSFLIEPPVQSFFHPPAVL